MSGWGGDFDAEPLIKADKVEQHIHAFPADDTLVWRGVLTGFGISCGVGIAVAAGKLVDFIIGLF